MSRKIIHGQRVDAVPGMQLYVMLRPHTDTNGHAWPAGTEYKPLCTGHDNITGRGYVQVSIGGETICFHARRGT